ncbi:ribonuclease H-like domain-containing protein [Tanacetum coccineum]
MNQLCLHQTLTKDKVIIEDWNSDDEDDVSEVSPVKTNETQTAKTQVDKIGQTSKKRQGVLTKTGLVNFVRPNEKRAVQTVNTVRPVSTARPLILGSCGPKTVDLGHAKKAVAIRDLVQDHTVWIGGSSSLHDWQQKAYPFTDYADYNEALWLFDELKFNLFSVSQICDKKNSVLFTETKCLILSPSFKLLDEKLGTMYECIMCLERNKSEFSVARTPQQNGVAERKNRTLIEAARTMLADSLLPIPFWAEAVNTACYVLNRVLVTKPQNKTNYEILIVLSIFDREDLNAVYQLVMEKYQDEMPEGFDKTNWKQNWKIVSWKLHSSSGIHTIMTDEGIVIHMLVENKYPLKKEVLSQLLKLKLETEEDSTMALELIRFVKKQIAELEPEDSDGDEKDL